MKGFAIETPSTLVVDQGTEFGVEVDASGKTGVVVFEGLVDLSRPESAETPAEVKRLVQGEGSGSTGTACSAGSSRWSDARETTSGRPGLRPTGTP